MAPQCGQVPGAGNRLKVPGDVAAVRMITTRHDTGIDYEVRASLRSLARGAFEEGDDEVCVWSENVSFGQTDATVAGGARFVEMARAQESAAGALWRRSHEKGA